MTKIDEILTYRPKFKGCATQEPSLDALVYAYYLRHMDATEALKYQDLYLKSIKKQLEKIGGKDVKKSGQMGTMGT